MHNELYTPQVKHSTNIQHFLIKITHWYNSPQGKQHFHYHQCLDSAIQLDMTCTWLQPLGYTFPEGTVEHHPVRCWGRSDQQDMEYTVMTPPQNRCLHTNNCVWHTVNPQYPLIQTLVNLNSKMTVLLGYLFQLYALLEYLTCTLSIQWVH